MPGKDPIARNDGGPAHGDERASIAPENGQYGSEQIKVLEGLEAVR